jgi:adenosylcobyric acid synthase
VVVLTYPYTANFDDLDPLANEPNLRLTWLRGGEPFPQDAALIVLPGSKSSIADLHYLRAQGWDKEIEKHAANGGHILGICGGYQLLGNTLSDPHAIEGPAQTVAGLGLLDVETIFTHEKITAPWQGNFGEKSVVGFELHCGKSSGDGCKTPVFIGENGPDGARTADDKIWGTYVHGLFVSDDFRAAYLQKLGAEPSGYRYFAHIETILDEWADVLETSLDIEQLLTLAQPVSAQ